MCIRDRPEKNVLFAFALSAGHREVDRVVSIDLKKITIGQLPDAASNKQLICLLYTSLHERTARQDSSCRRMFETAFLSPHIFIKSIIIAASAAEMAAMPTVPNSHFLPFSLAVM